MKWLFVTALALLSFAAAAQADTVVGPAYSVDGTIVFNGTNNCGGPCVETVNFSFTFEWINRSGLFGMGNYGSLVPGSFQATEFGTLATGPMTFLSNGQILCCGPGTYIPMAGFAGEMDLDVSMFNSVNVPPPPIVGAAFLFSCSGECFNQFAPNIGVNSPYDVTYTATAVPEPSSVTLAAGAILLVVMTLQSLKHRRRHLQPHSPNLG